MHILKFLKRREFPTSRACVNGQILDANFYNSVTTFSNISDFRLILLIKIASYLVANIYINILYYLDRFNKLFLKPFYIIPAYTWELHILIHPIQYIEYIVHYIMYNIHFTVYTLVYRVHCNPFTPEFIYSLQFTIYS